MLVVPASRAGCSSASIVAALLVAALSSNLAACRFGVLGRQLQTLDRKGFLRGTVSLPDGQPEGPIAVFAVPTGAESGPAADWVVLSRPGPFFLAVPVGAYRVGGFVDGDRSLTRATGEPAGWVDGATPVVVRPGEITDGLGLVLRDTSPAMPIAVTLPERTSAGIDELPASRLGEVVDLDDARFTDSAARIGLWRPVEFLTDIGAGIYFLEPYDPARIPVLFVHGALGHPGNFRNLVARLDRRRYQFWFAYYPSAANLQVLGAALGRWLLALEVEYGFERLGLVAHSMGGLVARAYLAGDPYGLGGTIDALSFISIATPWNGVAFAARGVARAPVVAPAWFDLVPDGQFLAWLLAAPLPPYAVHDLYFAYGGSSLSRVANDGVVTVESQLERRAQDQARRVIGFDDGHSTVLDTPILAETLSQSLAGLGAAK